MLPNHHTDGNHQIHSSTLSCCIRRRVLCQTASKLSALRLRSLLKHRVEYCKLALAEHAELCKPFRTEMCDGQLGDAQSRQTSALSEARLENRFVTRSSTPPASAVSSCYSSSWVGARLQERTPGKVPGRPRPRRPHPPPGPLCAPRAEPRLRCSAAK